MVSILCGGEPLRRGLWLVGESGELLSTLWAQRMAFGTGLTKRPREAQSGNQVLVYPGVSVTFELEFKMREASTGEQCSESVLSPSAAACLNPYGESSISFVVVEPLSHVQLFRDPMDCSPPGSSVHGILQARILGWVVIPFSGLFLTQGLNPGLPHCRQVLYRPSHRESPVFVNLDGINGTPSWRVHGDHLSYSDNFTSIP